MTYLFLVCRCAFDIQLFLLCTDDLLVPFLKIRSFYRAISRAFFESTTDGNLSLFDLMFLYFDSHEVVIKSSLSS
ncbi:unnamed protein product [Haemonchus placei]|uniref:Secreted protein n=1 Tax=Haemonchus placei TaxID=6290 RepID=A0A0N4VWU8_HAEPC|nr:unnamed protein product [Haemonchus placei]